MTYGLIAPYLRAFTIIIRDTQYKKLDPKDAKRRMIKTIEAGKARPDELYITVY